MQWFKMFAVTIIESTEKV